MKITLLAVAILVAVACGDFTTDPRCELNEVPHLDDIPPDTVWICERDKHEHGEMNPQQTPTIQPLAGR